MSHPTIKDDDLARLPLAAGRAELLREITSEAVEPAPSPRRPQGLPRWVPVAASVAAVGLVLAVPIWKLSGGQDGDVGGSPAMAPTPMSSTAPAAPSPAPSSPFEAPVSASASTSGPFAIVTDPATMPPTTPSTDAPSVPGGKYIALNAGWGLEYLSDSYGTREVSYRLGAATFEVTQYPADQYRRYYDDRKEISRATEITVLGRRATRWAYSNTDHTAIRVAEGGRFAEVRGSGMDLGAYEGLLDQLVQTDAKGFSGTVPDDGVTPFNHTRAIRALLRGVRVPPGFTADDVRLSGFNDAYQSATGVAGAVGCAWLDRWKADQPTTHDPVLAAFDSSTSWPLLQKIARQGGYSGEFWSVAAKLRAGQPVAAIRPGICG